MHRRHFLQNLAATAAVTEPLAAFQSTTHTTAPTDGYTVIAEFEGWNVLEDFRTRGDSTSYFRDPAARIAR